jgi:hypothetical protein
MGIMEKGIHPILKDSKIRILVLIGERYYSVLNVYLKTILPQQSIKMIV